MTMKGLKHTEETKKKMSEASMGKKHSEESKIKMSKAQKGRKHSEETKKKIGDSHRGFKHSELSKKKMSEALKGKYCGEKSYHFGKHHTEEARKKIGKAQRGDKNSNWRGGLSIQDGYKSIYIGNGRYAKEHRLVWIEHFGKIPRNCVIHHINFDKLDNRVENLQMMAISEHISLHHKGVRNGSH